MPENNSIHVLSWVSHLMWFRQFTGFVISALMATGVKADHMDVYFELGKWPKK